MDGASAADDQRRRDVSAHLEADIAGEADLALAIAVADTHTREEGPTVQLDGEDLAPVFVVAPHGGQLHLLCNVRPGRPVADYHASVTGTATRTGPALAFVALVSTW